ncbi:MAG TPA: DsbA family oxidoreductase [Gammaproteobacteria bacterium]|nr:DsbA family oxidoreductase [Gammaproteobacteria bacterium]
MSIEIKVWSDFVCPFCMIAEQPLLDAVRESGLDVAIEWMPFELRPYPTPTLRPEDNYLQSVWPRSVYPLAERYGVEIKLPSVSPQPYTALAWEGYQFAREHGKGSEYNDRVLKAFFQEDQDIGESEVLTRLAGELGLDQAAFRQALEERRYRETHQRALAQAQTMAVTAVPTIMIGAHRFAGVQGKELLLRALRDAEESNQNV